MRVFVSGQLGEKERIRGVFAQLEAVGATITHDWTRTDNLADYRAERPETARRAAADIAGVLSADVYVLMSDNVACGKGMYVELGAAIAIAELSNELDVFVVGPMNHESIFYYHPCVRWVPTVDDLVSILTDRADRRPLVATSA